MLKSKKFFALIILPLIYASSLGAREWTTEQARDARKEIVSHAKQYIGCPYVSGGIGPEYFDCSGLIYTVFHDAAGIQMPRSVRVIYSRAKIIPADSAEAGDLVFFKTTGDGSISHVGICIGKNQFIHAASAGSNTGVIVSSLKERYYANAFASVGRFLPSGKYKTSGDEGTYSDGTEDGAEGGSFEAGGSDSSGAKKKSQAKNLTVYNNAEWYKNLVFDSTFFCDWNFILPDRLMLNFRGVALETNVRYAGWPLQPGIGMAFRYNHGTKNCQIPLLASLTVSDYVKVYAGPVINFGSPKLPGNNDQDISGSFFPGILGVSFQTPKLQVGKTFLSLVQDVEYTVFNDTDGGAMNFRNSVATGLVFSTGLRVTLPAEGIFK